MTRPYGVTSLILASTSASLPEFVREAQRLKAALPVETRNTLERYELAGDMQHPDYQAAVLESAAMSSFSTAA